MNKTSSNPLVSVYITNHNYEKYIKQSINSVLKQTYSNYEVIIIDDGSTDNSKSIIERFSKNKKIKIIYQKNKGLNVSNNIALKFCRGEYITRLDADDWLDPNFLQIMLDTAKKDLDISMIFCNYYLVNHKGQVIDQYFRHDFKNVKLLDQPAHGACSLLRVKDLKSIGGYDEQFNCQDGVDLWFKFIQKFKVKNINLPLFYYRQHGKSLTKNQVKIFNTRDKILHKHGNIKTKKYNNILAIIPVRGQNYDPTLVALKKLNKTPVIQRLITELQKSKNIKKIIVSSPDQKILKFVAKKFKRKIIIEKRKEKFARLNTSLNDTIKLSVKKIKKKNFNPDLVLIVNVVCPFLNFKNFDAAINLIKIFDTDEVIAVKKENDRFYFHNGKSLKPFQKSQRLSLEREEVYREIGGLHLIKTKKIGKKNNKIGHIFLDENSSFVVKNSHDLEIANYIAKKNF